VTPNPAFGAASDGPFAFETSSSAQWKIGVSLPQTHLYRSNFTSFANVPTLTSDHPTYARVLAFSQSFSLKELDTQLATPLDSSNDAK
jgi:hypothetical protein